MIKRIITYMLISAIVLSLPQAAITQSPYQTIRYNLSGTDKDHTVSWDFFCTKGRKSGEWTKIPVPSNWELQGFGGYNYGHDKVKNDEEGLYRYTFKAGTAWKNKRIRIVFEGSMTDTEVKLNGKLAGDIHQGAFYRFSYDVTALIKTGEDNLLEVKVSKMSANASVNRAERQGDFWVFGGIFRPVYLEILPQEHIDRIAIDAKANGELNVNVYTPAVHTNQSIQVQVQQANSDKIEDQFSARVITGVTTLTKTITGIKQWNPEFPSLYNLVVSLTDDKGKILHQVTQKFGFRTIEVMKGDGIYVNSRKVMLKGVNHHSAWPETGRTLSKEIDLMDIKLIKEMNMNAVRMSHYPPDQSFLDLCDSLGLFVLDELTGWEAKYDTLVGRKLVKELVVRDVNHPSILFWDNGNEGGWNTALDKDYALYDPQQRTVLHPWGRFNGIDTKHYPIYNYIVNSSLYDNDIYMPTEFMHGLYDGGLGAGLDDFWNLMRQHPACAGGFLWAFLDEGVARTDKNGWLDTDGNHAPDGIVGPHREKEGSFYTIKEIWSPVFLDTKKINADFDGRIAVANRYIYTNLSQCSFEWKLVTWASPYDQNKVCRVDAFGKAKKISIPPGEKGWLPLDLPANWRNSEVLYITATDPYQREIFTWSLPIQSAAQVTAKWITGKAMQAITTREETNALVITSNGMEYYFDTNTGLLQKVTGNKKQFLLSDGPRQAGVTHTLQKLLHYAADSNYIIEPRYESDSFRVKWTFSPSHPLQLDYSYVQKNEADYTGITFRYPENKITGMTWLGNGPYRVWKNRMKGGTTNIWHKNYNNTITGESWIYPEFKGYHSKIYWVTVEQGEDAFTVFTTKDNLFLQMMQPQKPAGAGNENTSPPFPDATLGFLNAISPIGTKFKPATDMGPQSQKNMMLNYTPVTGTLWFDFNNESLKTKPFNK